MAHRPPGATTTVSSNNCSPSNPVLSTSRMKCPRGFDGVHPSFHPLIADSISSLEFSFRGFGKKKGLGMCNPKLLRNICRHTMRFAQMSFMYRHTYIIRKLVILLGVQFRNSRPTSLRLRICLKSSSITTNVQISSGKDLVDTIDCSTRGYFTPSTLRRPRPDHNKQTQLTETGNMRTLHAVR